MRNQNTTPKRKNSYSMVLPSQEEPIVSSDYETKMNIISFSGGRSSAMMLIRLVEREPEFLKNSIVQFADTGREHKECYAFIDNVEKYTGIEIKRITAYFKHSLESPFSSLLKKRPFLPGHRSRFCTTELKIIPMQQLMAQQGHTQYTNVVGFRFDEERRVHNKNTVSFAFNPKSKNTTIRTDFDTLDKQRNASEFVFVDYNYRFPLHEWGVTKEDVLSFWKQMPFDLESPLNGDSNCIFCPLKGMQQKIQLAKLCPLEAEIWAKDEEICGARYNNKYSIRTLIALSKNHIDFNTIESGDSISCGCAD